MGHEGPQRARHHGLRQDEPRSTGRRSVQTRQEVPQLSSAPRLWRPRKVEERFPRQRNPTSPSGPPTSPRSNPTTLSFLAQPPKLVGAVCRDGSSPLNYTRELPLAIAPVLFHVKSHL